jgi:parallel beta-helix repeat protein
MNFSLSRIALAITCCAALLLSPAAVAQLDLYVSPSGNDAWSGLLADPNAEGSDGPVKSVQRARDLIRERRATSGLTKPVNVHLRGGVYPIAEAITFTPEDSGSVKAPISYRAYAGETPIISGGISVTGWTQEGNLWVADVPAEAAVKDFHELWVDDVRRTPARTPNQTNPAGDEPLDSEFFYTTGPVMETGADGKEGKSATKFKFNPEQLQRWESVNGAIFVVFHSWGTSLLRPKNIDWEKNEIEFTGPARWPFTQWQNEQRYYVEHLFEALDSPGEWYLNRATNKLYYMPLEGEVLEGFSATIPQARQLIVLQGDPASGAFVDHLQFIGLDLRHCEYPIAPEGHSDSQAAARVNAAFESTGAHHGLVENCRIANVGTYGLWLRAGSQHWTVRGNELTDLGAGGVRIGETVSPETPAFAADRNVIDNNFLHDGGRVWREAVGVWIGRASYNEVTHNEIADFRYTGVSVGWSWGYDPSSAHHNKINFNHIHNIGRSQLNDMGGVYLLGIATGTEVKNNLIHDVISHPALYGGWGLYTDEGSSEVVLENNVVYNTRTGGFHQHYGRDNKVINNIFAYSHTPNIIRTRDEEHNSFFFERNIVLFNNGQLLGSSWKNNNFTMDNNTYWDTSGRPVTFKEKSFTEWQAAGHDRHSIIADPLFVDAESGDFTLRPESPARALGFKPIDLSKVGLYGDPDWVEKPKQIKRPAFMPPLSKQPKIESVSKIWDAGEHNAFTDILRHGDYFYVTHREATGHVGGDGLIRIIRSTDGETWESCGLLAEAGIDLRDPKLSITPDNRIMVCMGGSVYEGGETLKGRRPRVAFSADGTTWSAPEKVCAEGDWLWRVTWHEGTAYGVSYNNDPAIATENRFRLFVSKDGINYKIRTPLNITGRPNETTLQFMPDGTMMALVRREEDDKMGWIGTSPAPYTDWTWNTTNMRLGGPNFIRLPDGSLWAGTRQYGNGSKTVLAQMTKKNLKPVLEFPSGGDTSYPGLLWHDDMLWMSYYASHEGKTSIYLAKIKFE